MGRIVALGSIRLLSLCDPDDAELTAFVEQLVNWLRGRNSGGLSLLGMPGGMDVELQRQLQSLGFPSEIDQRPRFERVAVVVCLSSTTFGGELVEFVERGGGVLCGVLPERLDAVAEVLELEINPHLARAGLGFIAREVRLPAAGKSNCLRVVCRPAELERSGLLVPMEELAGLLESDDASPHLKRLDELVATVRLQIESLGRSEGNEALLKLRQVLLAYLTRTNYQQPDGLCCGGVHQLVMLLLCDVMSHLGPSELRAFGELAVRFPGLASGEVLETVEVSVRVDARTLTSLGVWIPAGVQSVVTCPRAPPGTVVQIGIHPDLTALEEPPWKRWPAVRQRFVLSGAQTTIASPFGGLVYLACRDETHSLGLTLTNVSRAPVWLNDLQWENVSALPHPWAEVVTRTTIFTVPTNLIRNKPLRKFAQQFDGLVVDVVAFIGLQVEQQFRIVADVQLPGLGGTSAYPLVVSYDTFEHLLHKPQDPSPALFATLMMVAITALHRSVFAESVEGAFGALAVSDAFRKAWPRTQPYEFVYRHTSPIFNAVWEAYTASDRRVFRNAFQKVDATVRAGPCESPLSVFIDGLKEGAPDRDWRSLEKLLRDPESAQARALPPYQAPVDVGDVRGTPR